MSMIQLFRVNQRRLLQSYSTTRFNQTATQTFPVSFGQEAVKLNEYYNQGQQQQQQQQQGILDNSPQSPQKKQQQQQQTLPPTVDIKENNNTFGINNNNQQQLLDLSFNNTTIAYKSKSFKELFRNYFVLSLCSSDKIVQNNNNLMKYSRKLLGQKGFEWLMRQTFYDQFVVGIDEQEIKPKIEHLRKFGVKAIIDYSAEEDVSGEQAALSLNSVDGNVIKDTNNNSGIGTTQIIDSHELNSDKNMNIFLNSIDSVASVTNSTGLVAIKLTALGRPQLLMKLTQIIEMMKKYNLQAHFSSVTSLLNNFQDALDKNQFDGKVDKQIIDSLKLSIDEENQLNNLLSRVHKVAKYASKHSVRCMVDAEQTYMQPAINMFVLELMKEYNKSEPILFNTYQCYLKSTYQTVIEDLEFAKRELFCFGAKLVRGAYIEQERERASRLNYDDPINEDYDATSKVYHKTLERMMKEIGFVKKVNSTSTSDGNKIPVINIMVASHNEDTVRLAIKKMDENNILPSDKLICFGSLYGMSDHVSFSLGQAGYSVYKYMPYGPIQEVLPYIGRRAIENNGFLTKLFRERQLIKKELIGRMTNNVNLLSKYTSGANYKSVC